MRTITLALLLALPSTLALAGEPQEMDTTLDRAVTLAEARGEAKPDKAPKGQAPAKRPASAKAVANAVDVAGILTATCADGLSYYHPTGEHRGACAKHGGVTSWADGSPVKSRGARKASYR